MKLDIVGLAEVAEMLGWDKRKLATYIKRGVFPEPYVRLKSTPIWHRKVINEYLKSNDYVPNATQMDRTTTRIYSFFGTNEKIVQSKYTEDEWNAYKEGLK